MPIADSSASRSASFYITLDDLRPYQQELGRRPEFDPAWAQVFDASSFVTRALRVCANVDHTPEKRPFQEVRGCPRAARVRRPEGSPPQIDLLENVAVSDRYW